MRSRSNVKVISLTRLVPFYGLVVNSSVLSTALSYRVNKDQFRATVILLFP